MPRDKPQPWQTPKPVRKRSDAAGGLLLQKAEGQVLCEFFVAAAAFHEGRDTEPGAEYRLATQHGRSPRESDAGLPVANPEIIVVKRLVAKFRCTLAKAVVEEAAERVQQQKEERFRKNLQAVKVGASPLNITGRFELELTTDRLIPDGIQTTRNDNHVIWPSCRSWKHPPHVIARKAVGDRTDSDAHRAARFRRSGWSTRGMAGSIRCDGL